MKSRCRAGRDPFAWTVAGQRGEAEDPQHALSSS